MLGLMKSIPNEYPGDTALQFFDKYGDLFSWQILGKEHVSTIMLLFLSKLNGAF